MKNSGSYLFLIAFLLFGFGGIACADGAENAKKVHLIRGQSDGSVLISVQTRGITTV